MTEHDDNRYADFLFVRRALALLCLCADGTVIGALFAHLPALVIQASVLAVLCALGLALCEWRLRLLGRRNRRGVEG